eukprot:EG_transcript_13077
MTLVDDQKDAIRATIFQDGVDKYYDLIENEKVYIFSKGSVKNANKKFTTLANDYELSFDQNAEILPAPDDNSIVRQKYTIVPIANLAHKEKNSNVDLCAVVTEVGEPTTIVTKAGESLRKRVITIADQSEAQVELTLWQESAENFRCSPGDVVALKNVRISDWSGISLSLSAQGSLVPHPDIDQARSLHQWLAGRGGSLDGIQSLTTKGFGGGAGTGADERKPISTIRDENLGVREDNKPDYLNIRATLIHIKQENMWYPACPEPKCNRKVTPVADQPGLYRCDKCEKNTDATFRYIVSMTANDHTGSLWLTAFQESAEALLGMDAKKLAAAQEADPNFIANHCKNVCFQEYVMRLRAKEEFVQDEKRMKCSVMKLERVNYKKESEVLLREIARYQSLAA